MLSNKDEIVSTIEVYETRNYAQFIPLVGQPKARAKKNARKLVPSIIRHNGNVNPITVNEDMEVIDGNTRVEACKAHKQPVKYVVINSEDHDSLELMKLLNTTNTQWSTLNLIEFYAKGYKYSNYITYLELLNEKGLTNEHAMPLSSTKFDKVTITSGEFQDLGIDFDVLDERCEFLLTVMESLDGVTDSTQVVARYLGALYLEDFDTQECITALSNHIGSVPRDALDDVSLDRIFNHCLKEHRLDAE